MIMKKAICLFMKGIVSTYLCAMYSYIMLYGFVVGAYEIQADNGTVFFIFYIAIAVLFPLTVCLMYHYIWYLKDKIDKLEDELDNIQYKN